MQSKRVRIPVIGTVGKGGKVALAMPIPKAEKQTPSKAFTSVLNKVFQSPDALAELLGHLWYGMDDEQRERYGINTKELHLATIRLREQSGDMVEAADAYTRLGEYYHDDLEQGIPVWEKALSLYRAHGFAGYGLEAWSWYADRLMQAGRHTEALVVLSELLDLVVAMPTEKHRGDFKHSTGSSDQLAQLLDTREPKLARLLRESNFRAIATAWKSFRGQKGGAR